MNDYPPLFAVGGIAVFLGMFYLSLSHDVATKRVVRPVVAALVAVWAAYFFLMNSTPDSQGRLLAAMLAIGLAYLLYRQFQFCRVCGRNVRFQMFPFAPYEKHCRFCGTPIDPVV